MNQAEARAFGKLGAFLIGERPADDNEAISAAHFLATRAQAALHEPEPLPVYRRAVEAGGLGVQPGEGPR